MVRRAAALVLFVICAVAPASAQQHFGPLTGPVAGPGLPSYNPGVPPQALGPVFGGPGPGVFFPRRPHPGFVPRVIVVPQQPGVVPPQFRSGGARDPVFGTLNDPFF
jgi:hypothetical protein